MISVKETEGKKNVVFKDFLWYVKTVIFVLVQIQMVIFCKSADFLRLLYPNLEEILYNAHNWQSRQLMFTLLRKLLHFTAKFVVSRCAFCKLRRNLGFFRSINHLSGPLTKHMFTWDWCILIHFVYFCVLRWGYTEWFAMTIFSPKQRCNVGTMLWLFETTLQCCVELKITVANRVM